MYLRSEDLRRMFVNACFWLLGREEDIPARADVRPILDYEPSDFGFGAPFSELPLDWFAPPPCFTGFFASASGSSSPPG